MQMGRTRPQRWAHRAPTERTQSQLEHRHQTVTDTAPHMAATSCSPVGKLSSGNQEGPRKISMNT